MDTVHFNGEDLEPLEVLGALAKHYGLRPDDYNEIFYQAYANHHTVTEARSEQGRYAQSAALRAWNECAQLPYWLLADYHYKVGAVA